MSAHPISVGLPLPGMVARPRRGVRLHLFRRERRSYLPPGARLLGAVLVLSRWLAVLFSRIHELAVLAGLARVSAAVDHSPHGLRSTLRDIWLSRLAREVLDFVLRTPLRRAALDLVTCSLPTSHETGCVYAICRTPWIRLLTAWCQEHTFALVLRGRARVECDGHNPPEGIAALCRLLRHVRHGGRLVAVANLFGGSRRCPLRFMGEDRSVSMLPAQLAAYAGVPLQAALPVFSGGRIHLIPGPRFAPERVTGDPAGVTRELLAFFETKIREQPAVLARFSILPP
jgi:hypothetical protein